MSSIISNIKISTFVVFALITNIAIGQPVTGRVIDKDNGTAIEYVNVGIPLQSIGTMCDKSGYYKLNIDPKFDNYRLFFSCVGYQDTSIVIS